MDKSPVISLKKEGPMIQRLLSERTRGDKEPEVPKGLLK